MNLLTGSSIGDKKGMEQAGKVGLNVHQQDVVSGVLHASFGRFRLNPFAPSLNENAIRLTANHQRDILDLLVQI